MPTSPAVAEFERIGSPLRLIRGEAGWPGTLSSCQGGWRAGQVLADLPLGGALEPAQSLLRSKI